MVFFLYTEKMEPKCTLHGSSASIMSVQFDQVVSVYEGGGGGGGE